MQLLTNKTALVTGGSRGIGRAIVLMLAEEGADVVFTYRSRVEEAEATVEAVKSLGRKCMAIQADAADFAAAQKVVDDALAFLGQIDILVNNAGVTRDTLIMRMTEQQWDEVLNTNLRSAFCYSKAVSTPMMRRRQGAIVSIASIVGLTGNAGQCNYAASKGGLISFTKSLAKELGSRNIRVNAVAPGFIQTDMTDGLMDKMTDDERKAWLENISLRRLGTPADVARVVTFLASDLAGYVTGEVINCSGQLRC